MSDFDDEPTEGLEATDDPAAAVPPKKARSQPDPDDDWDDDWDDDDTGRGPKPAAIVIGLAVVLTRPKYDPATTDAPEGASATTAVAAPVKNWQGAVADAVGENGKDAQKRAEGADGVYIWTDFGGWHVRNNNTQEVAITIAADQVRQKKTDDGDDGDENGDAPFATEGTVTLPAGDGSTGAGLDFGNSENATFTVKIGGKDVPADQILLGGAEGVAEENPVTFVKS